MATATARARRAGGAPLPSGAVARTVRVKRGAAPTHTPLTGFQQWAWRTFRDRVTAKPVDPVLEENLLKAHMRIRGDEYLAVVYAQTILAGIALAIAGALVGVLFTFVFDLWEVGVPIAIVLALGGTFGAFALLKSLPSSTAKARGRKIDNQISAAMSFVSAMSSADVNIDQIFKELAKQKIYGEVAEEAAWITRDTELLGVDILTAIKDGATRTPSKRFQDFLQGVVTTATSGGQLKPYFLAKAEQYQREKKLENLARVETMGLMAETFVTVVVAFPLFLVIIIAIFAIIGSSGQTMINILFGIVGAMIPLSQFAFIFVMYSMAQEF